MCNCLQLYYKRHLHSTSFNKAGTRTCNQHTSCSSVPLFTLGQWVILVVEDFSPPIIMCMLPPPLIPFSQIFLIYQSLYFSCELIWSCMHYRKVGKICIKWMPAWTLLYIIFQSAGCSTSAVDLCDWLDCVVGGVQSTLSSHRVIWTVKFSRQSSEVWLTIPAQKN